MTGKCADMYWMPGCNMRRVVANARNKTLTQHAKSLVCARAAGFSVAIPDVLPQLCTSDY